jgi:hypothetical protein
MRPIHMPRKIQQHRAHHRYIKCTNRLRARYCDWTHLRLSVYSGTPSTAPSGATASIRTIPDTTKQITFTLGFAARPSHKLPVTWHASDTGALHLVMSCLPPIPHTETNALLHTSRSFSPDGRTVEHSNIQIHRNLKQRLSSDLIAVLRNSCHTREIRLQVEGMGAARANQIRSDKRIWQP